MSLRFVVALALVLGATAVQGAQLSGIGAAIHGNSFNFAKPNLERPPVSTITVDGLKVTLQRTKLSELHKRFGGAIVNDGRGPDGATWLCYHTGIANAWFISNALGGQEFVMMVALEAAKRAPADCTSATFALPDLGIPGLGATTNDLKAAFGAAGSGNRVTYRADRPGGYSDVAQYVGYQMSGGKVVAVGVGETSVPTQH